MLAISSASLVLVVVTAGEPDDPFAVSVVIGASALAIAAVTSLVLLRLAPVGRAARAQAARRRALRRGFAIGAVVGIMALLRVVDGLTPLTALFVVLAFAVAEYVLVAGAGADARLR